MSDESSVTSTGDDVELRAMLAIVRYFAPLDRQACARVIEWAKGRYISAPFTPLPPDWMDSFNSALANAARQIGDVTPLDLIRLAEEAERVRDEREPEIATNRDDREASLSS